MRATALLAMMLALAGLAPCVQAEEVVDIPLADILAMPEARAKLDGSVRFYLQGQAVPEVKESLTTEVSGMKFNIWGKDAREACKQAALGSLLTFQVHAKRMGANAVIDIVSFYRKRESQSDVTYRCHIGSMIAGAALRGRFAKLAE